MTTTHNESPNAEEARLAEDSRREKNWKRWGPYLSERQWATVREDYSPDGISWSYFTHEHARSRVYRWGEDGLLGICDRECRLCFALALWNGRDPIIKERLFGLGGLEGNHGEDVKECYFYLDSTPSHSYMKALYKYPQGAFPYDLLREENKRRGRSDPEFEILDTGIFDGNKYFDVFIEYAKASPNDILIQIRVKNRAPEAATLHLLPTTWFRNTWSWGRSSEGYWPKPRIRQATDGMLLADHTTLGRFLLVAAPAAGEDPPPFLFTDNETNRERLFGQPSPSPFVKDAFHDYLVHGHEDAVNPAKMGTKAAAHYILDVPGEGERILRLRLFSEEEAPARFFGAGFEEIFESRKREAEEFYSSRLGRDLSEDEDRVLRQAYGGLLWTKQFYYYSVRDWLEGDPVHLPPPESRLQGRNAGWMHLYNRDVISMPDKWEYPWYAAWDLAFHMIPFSRLDPQFAKEQLVLFLREWYMHPNGQIPAYEFGLGDVNPPVHAWAAWRVYKMTGQKGSRDLVFLARVFHKLLINFTWWVNRKDALGNNLFSGGFLGLDNIPLFDRNRSLPEGQVLEQADGTAWMAFYCSTMLSMALELAHEDRAYEDVASKFFEHFVAIADAMNHVGGSGLWNEEDGFYYDQLHVDKRHVPVRVRSMVGIVPLFAVEVLEHDGIVRLPGFRKRLNWFLENRKDLAHHISYYTECNEEGCHQRRLLAIPTRDRLVRVLRYLLDENEFLSEYGIRSVSKSHGEQPYCLKVDGLEWCIDYVPAESDTALFGGNSNWRGPIWLPMNYLLIEALERYHHFYGNTLLVECPTGSGKEMNLQEVATELASRLSRMFLRDRKGRRPCHGGEWRFKEDPHWKDLVLFHEYFHGDSGKGLGASHQTGWTALVTRLIEDLARARQAAPIKLSATPRRVRRRVK